MKNRTSLKILAGCTLTAFFAYGPVKSYNDTNVCHSSESENPFFQMLTSSWIPAFAGMTTNYECIINGIDIFSMA